MCFEIFQEGYQICDIRKEDVDNKWFDCAIRLCTEEYGSDTEISSHNVCIETVTSHYEENIRRQNFIDEFKDIQMTVCVSASNTPAAVPSKSPTPSTTTTVSITPTPSITPTASITRTPSITATPSITPSKSGTPSVTPTKSTTPSKTPSPTTTSMCTEWYCENSEDSLTGEYPPRCLYTYEAQAGARRLQDWWCQDWQYKVPWEYNSCYDSCPYGTYTYQPDRTCVNYCPEGYYEDTMTYSCMVKSYGDGGGGSGSCPSGQYYDGSMCVDWCPMGTFADDNSKKCLSHCPSGTFGDKYYGKCVSICPEPYYGEKSMRICVEGCPEFTAPKDDTRTCESTLVYSCLDGSHELDGTTCYRYSGAQKRPCCGNGVCEPNKGETFYTCPADCPGTDYATLSWTSKWNDALTAPLGYGFLVDWTYEYNSFDSCIAQCNSELSGCTNDWANSARGRCQSTYTNIELQYCMDSVSSIASNQLQNQNAWDARSRAQQQSSCNGGGGWGTGCNYNNWCDSHEDCSCSDCSNDSKCSYNTGCNNNMICETHENCSCGDCTWDSMRCPGYRRLRRSTPHTYLRKGV